MKRETKTQKELRAIAISFSMEKLAKVNPGMFQQFADAIFSSSSVRKQKAIMSDLKRIEKYLDTKLF